MKGEYDPSIPDDLVKQYEEEFGFDPWTTFSTGLADEITLRVDNPHFGYDAEFQDGQVPLFMLEGTVVAGDADPEFSQWYTVGGGWEATRDGARLVREKGDRKGLNKQTNYNHLVQSLFAAAEKKSMATDMRRRGSPYDAKLWDGLELYMEREEYKFKIGDEDREGSRLLVKSIEKMPGTAERKTIKSREPATPPEATGGGDLSPVLRAKLRKLAQTVKGAGGDHSQFAEQAFSDVDGVLDNPQAEDAVMDTESGSIWAEA